jgi:histone H3/H4
MADDTDGITKKGTVEKFVKALHPVRISPEAVAVYMEELDKLTRAVTDKAVVLMQAGDRKTLSREDAKEAFRTIASTGDDTPVMEPAAIFRQLDRMPPPQVFEVVRLIQEWLAAQSKPR